MATKPLVSKVHDKLDKLEMDTRKAIKEKPENGKFLVDEFTKRVDDIAIDGLTDDQKKEYKSAVDKKVKDLTALAKSLTEKKRVNEEYKLSVRYKNKKTGEISTREYDCSGKTSDGILTMRNADKVAKENRGKDEEIVGYKYGVGFDKIDQDVIYFEDRKKFRLMFDSEDKAREFHERVGGEIGKVGNKHFVEIDEETFKGQGKKAYNLIKESKRGNMSKKRLKVDIDDLPYTIVVNIEELGYNPEDGDDLEELISDYLYDEYGVSSIGFEVYDTDTATGDITVTNIEWDTYDEHEFEMPWGGTERRRMPWDYTDDDDFDESLKRENMSKKNLKEGRQLNEAKKHDSKVINFDDVLDRKDYKEHFSEIEDLLGADETYGGNIDQIKNIKLYNDITIYTDGIDESYDFIFDALVDGDFDETDDDGKWIQKQWIRFDTRRIDGNPPIYACYYDEEGEPSCEITDCYYTGDRYYVVKEIMDMLYDAGYEFIDYPADDVRDYVNAPEYDEDDDDDDFDESLKNKKPMKENRGTKTMNTKTVMEAVEEVGKDRGQDVPMGVGDAGDMNKGVQATVDVTFADAVNQDKKNREKMGKMWKDMEKDSKDITPKDPESPIKEKNMFTEKLTLDESLFEAVDDDCDVADKVAKDWAQHDADAHTRMSFQQFSEDALDFGIAKECIKDAYATYKRELERLSESCKGKDCKKSFGKNVRKRLGESKKLRESFARYCDTDAQEAMANAIERLAKKAGVALHFGTKIGKYPQTLILDHKYQDGAVYIRRNGALEIGSEEFGDYHEDDYTIDDFDKDAIIAALKALDEVTESVSKRDDIDAKRDNRVERAKARFNKVRDDADAQRDDRLKKQGLKESKTIEIRDDGYWWKSDRANCFMELTDEKLDSLGMQMPLRNVLDLWWNSVELNGGEYITYKDSDGNYELDGLPESALDEIVEVDTDYQEDSSSDYYPYVFATFMRDLDEGCKGKECKSKRPFRKAPRKTPLGEQLKPSLKSKSQDLNRGAQVVYNTLQKQGMDVGVYAGEEYPELGQILVVFPNAGDKDKIKDAAVKAFASMGWQPTKVNDKALKDKFIIGFSNISTNQANAMRENKGRGVKSSKKLVESDNKIVFTQLPDDFYDDPTDDVEYYVDAWGLVIDGGRDFISFGNDTLLKIISGDYYDDEMGYDYDVDEEIKKVLGKEYDEYTIRGYNQRDWADVYAPAGTDPKIIDDLETYFFGKYDCFEDEDGVVYRVPHDIAWKGGKAIKEFLAKNCYGCSPDDIVLRKFTGYKRTPEYGDFDESMKRRPAKRGLKEGNYPGWRHMTSAQRHNARMDRIFQQYDKQNDDMAKFLSSKGISDDEIKTLRDNTGLHGNALSKKIYDMGWNDEFFKPMREAYKKKIVEKLTKEVKKQFPKCEGKVVLSKDRNSLYVLGESIGLPVKKFGAFKDGDKLTHNGREQEGTVKLGEAFMEALKKLTEAPIYGLVPQHDARQSFYGKAQVDTGDKGDKNKLYSYDTLVAEMKNGKPVVYGVFSATTLRHIKEWLKQNGFKAENQKQIMADYGVKKESLSQKKRVKKLSESISMEVDEDDLLDMLMNRVYDWNESSNDIVYKLYEKMYSNMIDEGIFEGAPLDINGVVDNDWVNWCNVVGPGDDGYDEILEAYNDGNWDVGDWGSIAAEEEEDGEIYFLIRQ